MRIRRQYRMLFITFLALSGLGNKCDGIQTLPGAPVACEAGTAQIAVWDGFLQTICGCGGTDGAIIPMNTALACSFAVGKTLFIYFNGKLPHQLVPVGSPGLPTTVVYNPNETLPIRVHAFTPSSAGSYGFKDQYEGQLAGTITVTP